MIDLTVDSWISGIKQKLARERVVFVHLGSAYPKTRAEILRHAQDVFSVKDYLSNSSEPGRVRIISNLESLLEDSDLTLGRLRERVFLDIDQQCQIILLSASPRSVYPPVPGSSIVHESKICLPPHFEDGFGLEALAEGMTEKLLLRKTMRELGESNCASLDAALFDEMNQDPFAALNRAESEFLFSSGLAIRSNEVVDWASGITIDKLREALSYAISEVRVPQDSFPKVSSSVWAIERRIRQAIRARANLLWGSRWPLELLESSKVIEECLSNARVHIVPEASQVEDLRDPLEWLSLEQVLRLRERRDIGTLGLSERYWKKFEIEFLPVKERIERSQLLRRDDGDITARWLSKIVSTLSTSGSEDPDVTIQNSPQPQASVLAALRTELRKNREFRGDIEKDFMLLASITLRFLINVYDTGPEFTKPFSDKKNAPLERHLQDAFRTFLDASQLSGMATCEVGTIAAGRADVVVHFNDGRRFVTEVKREFNKNDSASLEKEYLEQTLSYQSTNVPFSHLLVLDLVQNTPAHEERIDNSMWVVHRRNEQDMIVASTLISVVRGNKRVPSSRV